MSFLEFNDFEENYFFVGNDNNIDLLFQDDKESEYPGPISYNYYTSFQQ